MLIFNSGFVYRSKFAQECFMNICIGNNDEISYYDLQKIIQKFNCRTFQKFLKTPRISY